MSGDGTRSPKRSSMVFISTFNVALRVLAAFVIFLFGYLALFLSLVTCLVAVKVLYEGVKWVWVYAERSGSASPTISSGVGIPVYREKCSAIPIWR
jgi:hypothetical protein